MRGWRAWGGSAKTPASLTSSVARGSSWASCWCPWQSSRAPRTPAARPLRHLHALYRRLPHGGAGAFGRWIHARRAAVHLVLHHRAARPCPGGAPRGNGRARFRMRYLPGRLPVEPPRASDRRAGLLPALVRSAAGADGRNLRSRFPPHVRWNTRDPRPLLRIPAQRGDRHGQPGPPRIPPRPGAPGRFARPPGGGTCAVGPRQLPV